MNRYNRINKCRSCRVFKDYCYCSYLTEVATKSKISIILHTNETQLISNTARLAELTLKNSKTFIRGKKDLPFNAIDLIDENYENLYLFPDQDSEVLNEDFIAKITKPVNLIVPDGSWRQAKKILGREETFQKIKKVKLENIGESIYQLRKSPGKDSLCTFEAIAYALRVTENEEVFQTSIKNLQYMVRAHLTTRQTDKDQLRKSLLKVGINEI